MSRHFCQALSVGMATAFLGGCGGSQPPMSAPNTDGISSQSHRADALLPRVKHGTGPSGYISNVIVIIQENRSLENFFAGYPKANAPTSGCGLPTDSKNQMWRSGRQAVVVRSGDQVIPLHKDTFQKEPNLPHLFESAIIDWNNGRMDGFTHWGRGAHRTMPPIPTPNARKSRHIGRWRNNTSWPTTCFRPNSAPAGRDT